MLCLLPAACGSSSKKTSTTASSALTRSVASTQAPRATTSAVQTSSSTRATASLTVHLQTPASQPKAGSTWPITVSAHSASGKPVNGTVSYAFLFGGAVVARRPGGHMSSGVYHDRLEFPAQALGYPLTLEVIVEGEGARGTVTRAVKVER